MKSSRPTPSGAHQLTTYAELNQFVGAFAAGHLNLLLLVGGAGLAKSQSVRRTIGEQACWIEGAASAFGLYAKLYQHQNQLVVIDDVDSLYADKAAVRLLKCVCQTDAVKRVAWNTAAAAGDLPREFTTTSRVIIIANCFKNLNENVGAVLDRGHFVVFAPTAAEVHRQVGSWFDDAEIYAWFGAHLGLFAQPSMRHYVRAKELKAAGLDWIGMTAGQWLSPKATLILKLKNDSRFASEAERVAEFQRLGGGSRATYFNQAKKLRAA